MPVEVGHQAERGLGQPELRVVGQHAQVAGERQLAPGADRVPLHGRDRDDRPGERSQRNPAW